MTDLKQIGIVNMLARLQAAAYYGNDFLFNFVCACKVIELTIEYGVHARSPARFATLGGGIMILKNDHALSSHLCEIADSTQRRFGVQNAAETTIVIWCWALCRVKPFHEALNPLIEGYSKGVRGGDMERATSCMLAHSMYLPYVMGRPLGSIVQRLDKIAPQLEETKHMK